MTWGKRDNFALFVFKFDLAVFGGFFPCSSESGAVLEDDGLARACGSNIFVVAITTARLRNFHSNNNFGGELGGLTAVLLRLGSILTCRARIGKMRLTVGVGAKVRIGFGIISIGEAKAGAATEANIDI